MDNLPSFFKNVLQTTAPSASLLFAQGGRGRTGAFLGRLPGLCLVLSPRLHRAFPVFCIFELSLWGSQAGDPLPQIWVLHAVVSLTDVTTYHSFTNLPKTLLLTASLSFSLCCVHTLLLLLLVQWTLGRERH